MHLTNHEEHEVHEDKNMNKNKLIHYPTYQ